MISFHFSKIGVKVRVTNKGQVKTWSNSRGEGKLFSMDLLDDSGEIRMTAFNQQVDQMYELIKVCSYSIRTILFRVFFNYLLSVLLI